MKIKLSTEGLITFYTTHILVKKSELTQLKMEKQIIDDKISGVENEIKHCEDYLNQLKNKNIEVDDES